MTMTLSSRSMPSMVETYNDRPIERPSMLSNRPSMLSDRPSMLSDRPSMLSDRPSMLSDRPSMLSNRPSMLSPGETSMISDSPSITSTSSRTPSLVSDTSLGFSERSSTVDLHNGNRESDEGSLVSPESLVTQSQNANPPVIKRGKRKKYQKYTPEDRIAIGKHCFENGPAAARKAFQSRYPEMSESVTRGFRDKYKIMIGESAVYEFEQKQRKQELQKRTEPLPRGRPKKHKPIDAENGTHNTQPKPIEPRPIEPRLIEPKHRFSPKVNHYSVEEQLRIGKLCAQHGSVVGAKYILNEFPNLSEEFIRSCHRKYLDSEVPGQPQVFVLEGEKLENIPITNNVAITTISEQSLAQSTKGSHIRVSSKHSPVPSKHVSSDISSQISPISHSRSERHNLHSPNGTRPSINIQTSSVMSSQIASPIYHYPKVISPLPHTPNEERGDKREYSSTAQTNGYHSSEEHPYDRELYQYEEPETIEGPPHSYPYQESSGSTRAKRFKYQKYTPEDRYNIGKLCNDIGLGATVKVYREQFPRLNESVVRTFRTRYRELLQKGNGTPQMEAIERKPSRRSSIGVVEHEVVSQLKQFKLSHIELTTNLVLAVAENVVAAKDPKDMVGVRANINRDWANSLLWKHKLTIKVDGNVNGVCCERCKTPLVCPRC